jgi:uncharacterized protein YukE
VPPSKEDIRVATEALRTEARTWDHQSDQLHAIARQADGLRLSRLEAGLFQVIVSTYDTLAEEITTRCRQGNQRMAELASALRHVADTYDEEERRGVHAFRDLY